MSAEISKNEELRSDSKTNHSPITDSSITEDNPGEVITAHSSSSKFNCQPTVLISLDDEGDDECTNGSTSIINSRKRRWETSSRSFIPQFSGNQAGMDENEPLIKDTEDTTDGRSMITRSMNTVLNGCIKFSSAVMIICAFSAFAVAIVACKRISDLRFDETIQDPKLKTTHYLLYSLGVIIMITTGIALSYNPFVSIFRSIRDHSRPESRYEEI